MNKEKVKNLLDYSKTPAIIGIVIYPPIFFYILYSGYSYYLIFFTLLFLFILSGILFKIASRILRSKDDQPSGVECFVFSICYLIWPSFIFFVIVSILINFNNLVGDKIVDKLLSSSKESKVIEYEKLKLELKEMGVEV